MAVNADGGPMETTMTTPQSRTVAALSYLLFFVTGLIFFFLDPYDKDEFIRFHARQSIVFSVAWIAMLIIFAVFIAVLPPSLGWLLAGIRNLLNLLLAIYWVFLMYKAYRGEYYRIPELADRAEGLGF
jgi:uncharacterized membrane protein